jgi:hypothetical protein
VPARIIGANRIGVQKLEGKNDPDNSQGHPHKEMGEVPGRLPTQISYLIPFHLKNHSKSLK